MANLRSIDSKPPIIFSLTLFMSAALVFVVEPMIGKMSLPLLGGTPSVWITCMMFFQAMLLAGYVYAHIISIGLGIRRQILIHSIILVFALAWLPIGIAHAQIPAGGSNPIGGLLLILLISVGLPFFALSATAPLLQRWFAGTGHHLSSDPYFLYSASNAGSMLALLSYPLIIEPVFTLSEQSRFWSAGYMALIAVTSCCTYFTWTSRSTAGADHIAKDRHMDRADSGINLYDGFLWTVLAFVPSSLMLGVTSFLTTDIAAVPLFWIVPLSLYLLSFIIVFGKPRETLHKVMTILLLFSLPIIILLKYAVDIPQKWQFFIFLAHLLNLFIVSMVCHGELARRRPRSRYLTHFYLSMAFGGVLGGIFNALIAPVIFNSIAEYSVALFLSAILVPLENRYLRSVKYFLIGFAIVCLIAGDLLLRESGPNRADVVHRERTFFGLLTVIKDRGRNSMKLLHGTTTHGEQSLDPALRYEPGTYFQRQGAMGEFFSAFKGRADNGHLAIIGLGIGTLASYGEPGQELVFYEIDPAVKRIATDPVFFTFLRDARAKWRIIIGDARQKIKEAPDHYYDLIVLDAFSSDAIPVHLLTREAIRTYLTKLNDSGILLVNITNRYLNLEPVVDKLAEDTGLVGRIRFDRSGNYRPTWVALARKESDLGIADHSRWIKLSKGRSVRAWTDDYSNLLSSFKW